MWARWCRGLLEPGGGQGLCPKWALDQLFLGMGMLACPGWGCPLPILPRQGPLRSPATLSLSSLGCEVSWFHAPPAQGLTALLLGTLGWGISQPDMVSLISFSLSGGGEDDSFLFRGTLKASNGCLFSKTQLSRAIFCLDSLRKFAIALCGFFLLFFLFSLLPLACDFSKQPIFLMEALTVSCFLSLSSLTAWYELLRQTPLS